MRVKRRCRVPLIDAFGQLQCDVPEALPNVQGRGLIVSYRQRAVDVNSSFKMPRMCYAPLRLTRSAKPERTLVAY